MSFPNKNFLIVGQVVPAKRRVVVDGGEVAHFFPLWQKTEKGGAELITVTVVGNALWKYTGPRATAITSVVVVYFSAKPLVCLAHLEQTTERVLCMRFGYVPNFIGGGEGLRVAQRVLIPYEEFKITTVL